MDHLRIPHEDGSTLRGSTVGAEIWGTTEGQRLLELVAGDDGVRAAIGSWPVEGESRKIVASAVLTWQQHGSSPAEFSAEVEDQLWVSLRRTQIVGAAVCVAEDVTCSQTLAAGPGRQIMPPDDRFLQAVFPLNQPDNIINLPSRGFSLFVGTSQYERKMFSGVMGPSNAWIFNIPVIRELVWLASGKLTRLGRGVAWEMDPFPISRPEYFPPEIVNLSDPAAVDIAGIQSQLDELWPRLQVLTGDREEPQGFAESTRLVLDNIRLLSQSAMLAADPQVALQYAFAAADGSLLDKARTRHAAPQISHGNPAGQGLWSTATYSPGRTSP